MTRTNDLHDLMRQVSERGGPIQYQDIREDTNGQEITATQDGATAVVAVPEHIHPDEWAPWAATDTSWHSTWVQDMFSGVLRRDLLRRGAKRVETTVHADGSDCEVVMGMVGQEGPDVLTATLKAWLAFIDSR